MRPEWTFRDTQPEHSTPCRASSTGGRKLELQSQSLLTSSTHASLLPYCCTAHPSFDGYIAISHTWSAASTFCCPVWLTSMTAHLLVKFYSYFGVLSHIFPGWDDDSLLLIIKRTMFTLLLRSPLHCTVRGSAYASLFLVRWWASQWPRPSLCIAK